jgi:hypothetical protein
MPLDDFDPYRPAGDITWPPGYRQYPRFELPGTLELLYGPGVADAYLRLIDAAPGLAQLTPDEIVTTLSWVHRGMVGDLAIGHAILELAQAIKSQRRRSG